MNTGRPEMDKREDVPDLATCTRDLHGECDTREKFNGPALGYCEACRGVQSVVSGD
jgi:hypothetical protein